MSKIICPECDKSISSFAKECPNCGFPMADFLQEHNLNDSTKVWVCTKCGNQDNDNEKNPLCEYCKNPLVQTDIDNKTIYKIMSELKDDGYHQYTIDIAKQYGDDFSEEAYEHRIQKMNERHEYYMRKYERTHSQSQQPTQSSTPQVTCPYCKSTNCKKISSGSRWLSTGLFGLSSKKIGKQWHCNSCGSDF